MKIFYNSSVAKRLLFRKFQTCMFFGVVLTKLSHLTARTERHENIHIRQFWECCIAGAVLWCIAYGAASVFKGQLALGWVLTVPFTYYLLFGAEWLSAFCYHLLRGDARDRWNDEAYHASAFEMEAYAHEAEADYLRRRPWFAFVRYYGKI